jgi:DNA polymerase
MNLIFCDSETFAYDWLWVFIDPINREETVIVNDRKKFKAFYEKHKNDIFVGYNFRQYDQYIMKALLCDLDPKKCNDHIIVKKKQGWEFSKDLFRQIEIKFFDVMTTFHSLKSLEGFMGSNIKESEVDFTINRKLTKEEIEETIIYCRHDVEQTIQVFLRRKEEFDAHMAMLKAFKLPMSYISKTKVQLSAAALNAYPRKRNDEFDLVYPDTLKLDKYKWVKEWYDQPENRNYDSVLGTDKKPCLIAGVPHTFAWGGLHGARTCYCETGRFLNVDVASYYPSLMIRYGFGSRNMTDPKKYEQVYRQRLQYKAEGNPLQAPLKIVLNGTYGAMKDQYNPLYDPRQANNVCVGGQLLLLDLIEKLEPYCDIVQSNTDGILVKLRDNREQVESICNEWTERTGMVLEFDEFVKVIQRDVNNYIIVAEDGSYKSKGAVVKKQNSLDYDTPIINEAVVNYFVKEIPVEDTVNGCTELIKFQKIAKVSSKYDYAMYGCTFTSKGGRRWNGDGIKLTGKTFRVFASLDKTDGGMFKYASNKKNPQQFANTSEHSFFINDDISGMSIPNKLDKQFYIDWANRLIDEFINGKRRK